MRAGAKLAAYAALLAGVLAAGAAVGAAVGPLDDGVDVKHEGAVRTATSTVDVAPSASGHLTTGGVDDAGH